MTDTPEHDPALQALLQRRRFEPASAHLAERIIAAAHRRPQIPSLRAWLSDLLALALQPKSAFALAAVLVIGFVIGGALPSAPGDEDNSLQSYFESEGAHL